MPAEELERRSKVLVILLAIAFLFLAGRLGHLQVIQGDKWEEVSRGQRIRLVAIPAPRGNIFDRNGVLLAGNDPAFAVSLVYTGKPLPDAAVGRLSEILRIPAEDIRRKAQQLKPASGRPYQPVTLKTNISEEEHTLLEEHRDELPGVVIDVQPLRLYPGLSPDPAKAPAPDPADPEAAFEPGRRLAAHVLGTVKMGDRSPAPQGSDGLEAWYNGAPRDDSTPEELGLQGRDGVRRIEVDAQGRPARVLGALAPVPGNNLVLTLDARLQAAAERGLLKRMSELRKMRNESCPNGCAAEFGAAVAIDPRNGEILVLASVPSFDPNAFAERIYAVPGTDEYNRWRETWQGLNNDPGRPLLNHATTDAAPPGSTFKPVTALAALEAGVTTPAERVVCPGYLDAGIRFGDWRAHGIVNMEQALGRSCNVYFFRMAQRMKIETLVNMARQFGLGQKTGLEERDGITEIAGWLAGPETKKIRHPKEPTWYPTQNLSVAIGQDDNQMTPLQMANVAATLANGGTRYRPHLVKAVTDPKGKVLRRFGPEVLGRVRADPKNFEVVRKGMLSVTRLNPGWSGPDSQAGTAYGVFADFPQKTKERLGREVLVAGKTGSAETGRKGETPWGWFIAFAPYDKPEIAIAVAVRHGGGGALAGAPVARAILDEYFGLNTSQRTSDEPGVEVDEPLPQPPAGQAPASGTLPAPRLAPQPPATGQRAPSVPGEVYQPREPASD